MTVYVIKRDSDGFYRTAGATWSPSVRLAARYDDTPWIADSDEAWVKLRVKKAGPAPDPIEMAVAEACIADLRGILKAHRHEHWLAAARRVMGQIDVMASSAERLLADRDAMRARVDLMELEACEGRACLGRLEAKLAAKENEIAGWKEGHAEVKAWAKGAEEDLATAIRERDAAVHLASKNEAWAMASDVACDQITRERDEALAKLEYQATEWSALVEPRARWEAREAELQAKLAEVTRELAASHSRAEAAEAQLSNLREDRGAWKRDAQKHLDTNAGLEAKLAAAEKALGEATTRAERAEGMLADSMDSARLVYGYVKREHYIADIAKVEGEKSAALARATAAESTLATIRGLVGE